MYATFGYPNFEVGLGREFYTRYASPIDLFSIPSAILDYMQKLWWPNCRGEIMQENMQNICLKNELIKDLQEELKLKQS